MAHATTNRYPALLAAALGHVAVVAALLIGWPWLSKPVELGKVVPVTLVTNGPPADLAPAEKAPQPAPALAPAPTPEAPPQPAPISSAPPTPPAPASTPKPSQQAKPTPNKSNAKQGLDLDQLMASLSSSPAKASTQQTSGQPGANRQKTAPVSQQGQGQDDHLSANELQALGDKLGKLWNPNCQVLGSNTTVIKVHLQLTPQGFVVRKELVNQAEIQASNNPVLVAAADRALSAVGRGEPYTDVLPPEHYAAWRDIIVKFNAKQVCSK
jgi:hypothetical protein